MNQRGTNAAHVVPDSAGSYTNSSEAFSVAKSGTQTYTQDQSGLTQNGALAITALTRHDTGNDTFTVNDGGSSNWHAVLGTNGSFSDGTDSFTLVQTGSETYTQDLTGSATGGVPVAGNLTRNDTALAAFTLTDQGTAAWQAVDPGNSTQNGTDSFTMSKAGNDTFIQQLVGHDAVSSQATRFAVDSLISDDTGADSFTLDDQGTSFYSAILDDLGSTANGTDSYTQHKNGSETYHQHQTGQDQNGVFTTASVLADGTANDSFTLQDQSTSNSHSVLDGWGSTDDNLDSNSSTQSGSETSSQHMVAGLDANANLALTTFTQASAVTASLSVTDTNTDTWYSVDDGYGSHSQAIDKTTVTNTATEASTQFLTGHDISGTFNIDTLTASDSGTSTFTQKEMTTSSWHTLAADLSGVDDGTDSITQTSSGNETFTQYQGGANDPTTDAFSLDSFTLNDTGSETKGSVDVGTDTAAPYPAGPIGLTVVTKTTATTTSADAFTLSQLGRDITGAFVTTSEVGHSAGAETFVLDQEIDTTNYAQSANGSTESDAQTDIQHKTGGDSFILDKNGVAVNNVFQPSLVNITRTGTETYHQQTTTTQSWHNVPDTLGSTEDGTATNTLIKDGTDGFTRQDLQTIDSQGRTHLYSSNDQNGTETYSQSGDVTKQWHTVQRPNDEAQYPYPYLYYVNVEDGNSHSHRTDTGADCFTLHTVGADDGSGSGYKVTGSTLNSTTSDTYLETDTSSKSYTVGTTQGYQSSATNAYYPESYHSGSVSETETHTGSGSSTSQQLVCDVANDVSISATNSTTNSETYSLASNGSDLLYTIDGAGEVLNDTTTYSLSKSGQSSMGQYEADLKVNDTLTARSFDFTQTGSESYHMQTTDHDVDDGVGSIMLGQRGGPAKPPNWQTWGWVHAEDTMVLTKDGTSSYTLHQAGDLTSVSQQSRQVSSDSYHQTDQGIWTANQVNNNTVTGEQNTLTNNSTGTATKDGADASTITATGTGARRR